MPGERIHIAGGKVYVNGEALEIPDFMPEGQFYTSPDSRYSNFKYGILEDDEYSLVPKGHYLLLGDNSDMSRDGRVFGWMPNEHIMGRVSCIWWPPPRWRDFTGFTGSWWWNTLLAVIALAALFRMFIGRSWSMPARDGTGETHYLMLFIAYGLRMPFGFAWIKRWASPQRGDYVLYAPVSPHAEAGALTAGRIVALPGERVCIEDGGILVNDAPLEMEGLDCAKYVSDHPDAVYGRGKNKKNTTVPEGMYFILTDTPEHGNALDSRLLGWVPSARIAAKAKCVWWPVAGARKLP